MKNAEKQSKKNVPRETITLWRALVGFCGQNWKNKQKMRRKQ